MLDLIKLWEKKGEKKMNVVDGACVDFEFEGQSYTFLFPRHISYYFHEKRVFGFKGALCKRKNCMKTDLNLPKKERFRTCPSCKSVYYCSQLCRKLDWEDHREECKDFRKNPKKEEDMKTKIDPNDPFVNYGVFVFIVKLFEASLRCLTTKLPVHFLRGFWVFSPQTEDPKPQFTHFYPLSETKEKLEQFVEIIYSSLDVHISRYLKRHIFNIESECVGLVFLFIPELDAFKPFYIVPKGKVASLIL
jgi:hypothetical protein